MISVRAATADDLKNIQSIAHTTWPHTYKTIVSHEQINYMLELFYSIKSLQKSTADGQYFLIAEDNSTAVGFCAFQHFDDENRKLTKIQKLYVLPDIQGKGVGRRLLEAAEIFARKNHSGVLSLNVNRQNPAIDFYKKMDFSIAYQEDIQLDHGYFMNDYVMEKTL
ncbi:MAG TPA: GNAT family N-acetyltransferase [Flavobacterium sp.]|jgi:GNAT superfamily N-acetyltransferase